MASTNDKVMPVMILNDHKTNKHDLFTRYFGELRAWVVLVMQRALSELKDAPSSTGFDWMFIDIPHMTAAPSFPKDKAVPPKKTAPATRVDILARRKRRKQVRAYNTSLARLRQAGQDQLWACLKRSFGTVHSAWFDEHDPFMLLQRATTEVHDMSLDAAEQHLAIARDAGKYHGSRMFLRLQKHYTNVQPTGILSRILDAEAAENSFNGDWEAYRNKMTSVWHQLRSSVESYSPEQLQVLKCLTALINNPNGRFDSWRQWAQNYLLNHGAQPSAWTLEGFLTLGTEQADSQAVTSRSARGALANRAQASYANADQNAQRHPPRPQRGGHGGPRGGHGGRGGRFRPGGAPASNHWSNFDKFCSNCNAKFKPSNPQHTLCDSCHRGGALNNYVGSMDGAARLKGKIDKKRKANFAKSKRAKANMAQAKRAQANVAQAHDQAPAPLGFAALPPPPPAGANLMQAAAQASAARQVLLPHGGALRDRRVGFDLRQTMGAPADVRHVYAPPAQAQVMHARPVEGMPVYGFADASWPPAVCNYAQVAMAMDAQPFSIPDELRLQVPEDCAVLDSGATYHTVGNDALILEPQHTSMLLTWGNGDTSRAMSQGRLICSTIILQTAHLGTSATCGNYLLTSQTQGDALYSPDVTRNLVSVPRLINDGHAIRLEGSYPHIVLGGPDGAYCIPLIHAEGYWFVPMWKPPSCYAFSGSSPAQQHHPFGLGGGSAGEGTQTNAEAGGEALMVDSQEQELAAADDDDSDAGLPELLHSSSDEESDEESDDDSDAPPGPSADYVSDPVTPFAARQLDIEAQLQHVHPSVRSSMAHHIAHQEYMRELDSDPDNDYYDRVAQIWDEYLERNNLIDDDEWIDVADMAEDEGELIEAEDEEEDDEDEDSDDADADADGDDGDDDDDSAGASEASSKLSAKSKNKKPPLKRGKRLTLTEQRNLRKALQEAHEKYGHVDPKKLVCGKMHGRFHSSSIPQRGRHLWSVKDCPVCITMKQQKPPKPKRRPKELLLQDKADWLPWEKVVADSSGKHRVASRQGMRYFTIFKCWVTGDRRYFAHRRKSHYTLVFLKLCAQLGRWPRVLVSDTAGEVIKKSLRLMLVAKGTVIETIPRSEHHLTGSIEIEIKHLSNAVKCTMAARNIPPNLWDIVGEYLTLMDCCIRASPLSKEISCHEAATSELPDLDQLKPVGCFAIRHADKLARSDFKLSPANDCGTFIGLAHLGETFGAVLMTDKSLIIARDNISYIVDLFPLTKKPPAHKSWNHLHKLLQGQAEATDVVTTTDDGEIEMPADAVLPMTAETLTDSDSDAMEDDAELTDMLKHMPDIAGPADPVMHASTVDGYSYQKHDHDTRRMLENDLAQPPGIAATRAKRSARIARTERRHGEQAASSSKPAAVKSPKQTVTRQQLADTDAARYDAGIKRNAPFTIADLTANKTLIVGRKLKRMFEGIGGATGTVQHYDSQRNEYHLTYADGWEEDLPFEDVLRLLPKSWLAKEDKANAAMALWALARAESCADAFAAHSTPKPLASAVITEPKSHIEAMHAPDAAEWGEAFDKEWYALQEMGCFTVIAEHDVPKNKSVLRSKWVLKLKFKDNVFERRKVRLVICGYDMIKHVDYEQSYSPTCSQASLRLVLALTSTPGWLSFDYDAVNAFISAKLEPQEYLYMRPLPGYDIGPGNVLQVERNLYGSVEASRKFYLLTHDVYVNAAKLKPLQSDSCIFVRFERNTIGETNAVDAEAFLLAGGFNGMRHIPEAERRFKSCPHAIAALIILLYVDNNGCRCNCLELRDQFLSDVSKDGRITLVLEGGFNWFLGVRYSYDLQSGAVTCDQEAYITTLLHRHGMTDCHPESLPMPNKFDIYALPVPAKPDKLLIASYASLCGELLYISINTAPELSQSMHQLTRFMTKAGPPHLKCAKHVLKYCKKHRCRTLRWCALDATVPRSPFTIYGFADASWADDRLGRKSSMFYALFVNGAAFCWKTQLSSITATSTAEAELMSLSACVQEVMWARNLALELGFGQMMPTIIYEDNEACIKMVHKELNRSRSKHIHLKYCFMHQHYVQGTFDAVPVASADQVADIGTALRPLPQHDRCSRVLHGEPLV